MPHTTKVYVGSVDDADERLLDLKLRRCELLMEPLWAYTFPCNATLIHFALDFSSNFPVQGNTMFLPECKKGDADAILTGLDLLDCVHRCALFVVQVWDQTVEAALDAEFN
jgi:hypothetical protein